MIFKIVGVKNGEQKTFRYDNFENTLSDDIGNVFESQNSNFSSQDQPNYTPFSPEDPLKKSNNITTLKIQLGLTCNYSCEYCSQRFVPRADETSRKHVEEFMRKLDENIIFSEKNGLRIEFWGGEPFVYWKTIQPLMEALKKKFQNWNRKPVYSIISNGSLLTDEICDWIVDNLTAFCISHDGPGQFVRGEDPFQNEELKQRIINLYHRMKKERKHMSFNAMINGDNISRKGVSEWFYSTIGENVSIGEGGFVDAYDEGGISVSLKTKESFFKFRKTAFKEIFENGDMGFSIVKTKINQCVQGILNHSPARTISQKCGMDDENTIAVDLKGNVITCQNVSHVAINSNNQPHVGGNIEEMSKVRITSSTHWSNRPDCANCPVLHVCRGSCMYASNEYWTQSCTNSYSDNIVFFALAFERITGYIPIFIDNDVLPDDRKDIWGCVLKHEEEQPKPSKGKFPIPVVSA